MNTLLKKHALFVGLMLAIATLYFLPTFNGKTHGMEDVRQSMLTMLEAKSYEAKEGEAPGWTNQLFGGMPNDLVYQGTGVPNILYYVTYNIPFASSTSYPFQNLLLCFIGFYVFLLCFNVKPELAFFGALAYGFMSFTFSSIEAAHINKVFAIAIIPPVIGGLYLMAKGKLWSGFVVFTYHLSLQIFYFHYQITYYTALFLAVFGLFYLVRNLAEKQFKTALMMVVLGIAGTGLATVSNLQRLVTTETYSKYTMRGGSPLKSETEAGAATKSNGLEKEYAFSWSYGVGESFTVLIPGLYGGSSRESVTTNSPLYKKYNNVQILEQGWPLYHGDMPSTSGPVYFGAIVMFLFLLGIRIVKSDVKWPLLIVTLISFMLAWGKHFPSLNYFLFDNLPFYNKFRTPMMALVMAQVSVLTLALLAFATLLQSKLDKPFFKQHVLPVFYGVGGFLLFTMVFGSTLFGTGSENDSRMFGDNVTLLQSVVETRAHLIMADSFRSLLFIGVAVLILWLLTQQKIKSSIALYLIGGFMVIDLVGVDMRYLTWSDFNQDAASLEMPVADQVDLDILRDADPHYRVMDMSRDPFNTNDAGAFHKLVGGYHAAKLSRYQDLISSYIVPNETREKALDMLNCKYIMGTDKEGRRLSQKRESALGNAWFVNEVVTTFSENEEMENLIKIDPAKQAVMNIKDQKLSISEDIALEDENAAIQLTIYHPDTLRYVYESPYQRFVVFSEVYYPFWKLYFNGEELPLHRVNYTLRGAVLPPGKGDIEMVYTYKPAKVHLTETRASSILVLALALFWSFSQLWKFYKKPKQA